MKVAIERAELWAITPCTKQARVLGTTKVSLEEGI